MSKPTGLAVRIAAYIAPLSLAIITLYSASYVMPSSALVLPFYENAKQVGPVLWPQGWAFFTKSPRIPELTAMRMPTSTITGEQKLESLTYGPNAQAKWLFGADRTSRIQEFEYDLLNSASSHISWYECKGRVDLNCVNELTLTSTISTVTVINDSPIASLCGELLLVRFGITAWAYINAGFSDDLTVDEIKILDVKCSSSAIN